MRSVGFGKTDDQGRSSSGSFSFYFEKGALDCRGPGVGELLALFRAWEQRER